MMGRTHMVFGFLAGLLFLPQTNTLNMIIFLSLTTFSSLFPDIDHEGSKINKIFPITKVFAKFFKHRGFFHTIFPPAIIYGLAYVFGWTSIALPIVIGYLAHLFSDGLTKMGVNLLHPVATLRVQGFIQTGGLWEMITLVVVLIIALTSGLLKFW